MSEAMTAGGMQGNASYYHGWWAAPPEEERRFRVILWAVLLLMLAAGLAVPFIPVPEIDHSVAPELPPRLARLIVERKPPPPPPPPEVKEPEPAPPAPEAEKKEVEKKEPPKPEPPKTPPKPDKAAARKKAARSGLLALRSELAALRSNTVIKKLEKKAIKPLKKASARPVITAPPSVLEKEVTRTSGGIDTASLSRETGDTELAEHEVIQVVSPGDDLPPSQQPATRSNEEIKLVFDQNKGRLNTLYNRALRKNPALAGKVVLQLTIAPSGEVTACEIVSSELQDPLLEHKLVTRVLLFDFGEKDVPEVTISYPLEFFPG